MKPLIFFLSLLVSTASAANLTGSLTIFGITARWEADSSEGAKKLERELEVISSEGREYFDPDCRWRKKLPDHSCPLSELGKKTSDELTSLSAEYKKETLDFFDIRHTKKSGEIGDRDFGGIWQGYVLEALKKKIPGDWLLDFSGDIFVTDFKFMGKALAIGDSVFDAVDYAKVSMKHGFMDTSVNKHLGSLVKVPDAIRKADQPLDKDQILKIVLFAGPEFSGSRIDAWSTAIAAGGLKVLNSLWANEKYSGKWGYFYFDPAGIPHCSKNVKCNLSGGDKTVESPF